MHETVRRLEKISIQLNAVPDVADTVDKLVGGSEVGLVGGVDVPCSGCWPKYQEAKEQDFFKGGAKSQSERDINTQDYATYAYYRAGPDRTTMLSDWIQKTLRHADFAQAHQNVKSLWRLDEDRANKVLTRVVRNALLNKSFQDDKGDRVEYAPSPLVRRQLTVLIQEAFPEADLTHQFLVDREKEVIVEMLKTGKSKGLFDYLVDKEIEIDGVSKVVLSKPEFNAAVPAAAALSAGYIATSAAGRNGAVGATAAELMVNGVQGAKVDLGLPIYVELKGQLGAGKTTSNLSATTSYKLGNTTFAVNHTYANNGGGFKENSKQQETNLAIAQSFGSMFVEGSIGSISADNVHYQDWKGSQYQLTFGVDTAWITPYIQFAYRDLDTRSDKASYVGLDLHMDTVKADS